MHGVAAPDDLRALREQGWSVREMARRFRVAEGTIRRAMRHETGIINVRPSLITGDELPVIRRGVCCTPAYIVHAIADGKPMLGSYYKIHEARAQATRRAQRLASLKRAGVDGATIRIYLKYRGERLV